MSGHKHGFLSQSGSHEGDLPNIDITSFGTGRLDVTTDRVSLAAGATSLLDADGSAIVLHAGPDDLRTDPAGGSGDRIACGVLSLDR